MRKASNREDDNKQIPGYAFARGVRGRHVADFKASGLEEAAASTSMDVWAPLAEFPGGNAQWQLAPDTWIETTTHPELFESKAAEDFLSKEERELCRETRYWLHFIRPVHHQLSPKAAVNSFLLALWIVRPTPTYVPLRFERTDSEFSVSRVLDRFQWIPGYVAAKVTDRDLGAVASILLPLREVYLTGRRLRNAVVLTFRGCVSVDWQSAFICLTAAAEAILTHSGGPGLPNRLAAAHGKLVAKSSSDRKAAAERFKRVYTVSSKIIHGRAYDRPSSERNLADLADCSEVLRTLWRAVLTDEHAREALERDDKGRQSFLAGKG